MAGKFAKNFHSLPAGLGPCKSVPRQGLYSWEKMRPGSQGDGGNWTEYWYLYGCNDKLSKWDWPWSWFQPFAACQYMNSTYSWRALVRRFTLAAGLQNSRHAGNPVHSISLVTSWWVCYIWHDISNGWAILLLMVIARGYTQVLFNAIVKIGSLPVTKQRVSLTEGNHSGLDCCRIKLQQW
jgi:hypothetical protein